MLFARWSPALLTPLLVSLATGLALVGCKERVPLPAPPSPEFNCPLEAPAPFDAPPLPEPGLSSAPPLYTSEICGYSQTGLRRLNRTEYGATVRDLLGIGGAPARAFPEDDVGAGFDNIAALLGTAPLWMETHENAVRESLATALR